MKPTMKRARILVCAALLLGACEKGNENPNSTTDETPFAEAADSPTGGQSGALQQVVQRFEAAADPDQRAEIASQFVELAYGNVPHGEITSTLAKLLQNEPDKEVKLNLLNCISEIDEPDVILKIGVALAPDQPKEVRSAAIDLLENYGDKRAIPMLQKAANDPDGEIAKHAADAVASLTEAAAEATP